MTKNWARSFLIVPKPRNIRATYRAIKINVTIAPVASRHPKNLANPFPEPLAKATSAKMLKISTIARTLHEIQIRLRICGVK